MNKFLKPLISATLLLSSPTLLAVDTTYDNTGSKEYKNLYVTITNHTGTDCIRIQKNFPWGISLITPPNRIYSGTSAFFILSNGKVSGPKMSLTYHCGKDNISIENSQNVCLPGFSLMFGCAVTAKVVDITDGISEHHGSSNASWYHNHHGEVDWLIERNY